MKDIKKFDKIVPDTSVIIDGLLSRSLIEKKLVVNKIIIHEAVLAELESQANKNRESGFLGLEEIKSLRELAKDFIVEFKGSRPGDFEIKFAKAGEIDSIIRDLALSENAVLVTADIVQAEVAKAKGIPYYLHEFEEQEFNLKLEKYFGKDTMSVHIRQDCLITAKKGRPGKWKYENISKDVIDAQAIKELYENAFENAKMRHDSFIESEKKGSTIMQVDKYRIVMCRPPLSDAYEITAVRPIVTLSFEDYKLDTKLVKRLETKTEGILIAGAPGQGKSTFVQALAKKYLELGRSIRTIEMPRDLQVPNEISQYSLSHASNQELHDVLLLSRPDYTFFDELRNTSDFNLFKDLRLSGIGMAGVIHSTEPIDAIQRFVGKIEMGMIPHIIDTVVFIKEGEINSVLSIDIEVKVPSGMTESDLARPVVVIHDFFTGALVYEIYSYGEETVIIPVSLVKNIGGVAKLAEKYLKNEFRKYDDELMVSVLSDNEAFIYVKKEAITEVLGVKGFNVSNLEKKYGLKLNIKEKVVEKKLDLDKEILKYSLDITPNDLIIKLGHEISDKSVDIYIDDEFLMTANASKKAIIKLSKNSGFCKMLLNAMKNKSKIKLLG